MKKHFAVMLILAFLLSFSAVFADDLADVKQAGVLRFGHHVDYVPFVYDDSTGTTTGIDIALMDEVARRLGVKLQPVPLAWDGIIDSLNLGQADVIGGGLAITDERKEKIDFTRGYYTAETVLVSLASTPVPAQVSYDSLRGMKLAVEKGSSFEIWVRDVLAAQGYVNWADVYTFSTTVLTKRGATTTKKTKGPKKGTYYIAIMREQTDQNLIDRMNGYMKITREEIKKEEDTENN